MSKRLMALMMASMVPTSAMALEASDLSGRWVITWSNSTQNDVTLDYSGGRLSGTYINDSKRPCTMAAAFDPQTNKLTSQLACPLWEIGMLGTASPDGRSVDGSYNFGTGASGTFTMEKQ
jgi:hypothetical protein